MLPWPAHGGEFANFIAWSRMLLELLGNCAVKVVAVGNWYGH